MAIGNRDYLNVWGNDFDTPDGTGSRDYVHVLDLADGHLAALDYLNKNGGMLTVNLGSGHSYSVLEMVKAFEKASGQSIAYKIGPRRVGDIAQCTADTSLARRLLGWKCKRGLEKMSGSSTFNSLIRATNISFSGESFTPMAGKRRINSVLASFVISSGVSFDFPMKETISESIVTS